MRVSDGVEDKGTHGKAPSSRMKSVLQKGALLVEWDPDPDRGEAEASLMWLVLRSDRWNGDGHLAWRWDPSELARREAEAASRSCCA